MNVGEPIPGQGGTDQGIATNPNAEQQKDVRVTGDEFDSPQEKEMLEIAQRVRDSIAELPPNVPEYGKSNQFWNTVDILKKPDVIYSDVHIYPGQTDEHGTRRSFTRTMQDESGQEIGKWVKDGFVTPDGRLATFSESITSPDFRTQQKVSVSFDKEGRVSQVSKYIFNDGKSSGSTEINYLYDFRDGRLNRISYAERDQEEHITSEKSQWLSYDTPRQAPMDRTVLPIPTSPPTVNTPVEPPLPGIRRGFLRFLGRK